jgi:hypothetical protein
VQAQASSLIVIRSLEFDCFRINQGVRIMPRRRSTASPVFEALEPRIVLSMGTVSPTAHLSRHLEHSGQGAPGISASHGFNNEGMAIQIPSGRHSEIARSRGNRGGFHVGYRFVEPISFINVQGSFDPSAKTLVYFTPLSGRRMVETPESVSATNVTVGVPLSINPRTGRFNSHGYSVTIVQSTTGGKEKTPAVYHLQIETPPATGLPPGTLVNAFLSGEQNVLSDEIAKAEAVAALSNGKADVSQLVNDLTTARQAMSQEQQMFQQLMDGQVDSLPVGQANGHPVTITRDSLGAMDQVIALAFSDAGSTVTEASLPARPRGVAAKTSSIQARAFSSSDALANIQQYFTNLTNLHSQAPTHDELEEAEKEGQVLGYVAKAEGVILVLAFGEIAVPVATGLGVATWAYTTLKPFFSTDVAVEATLNDALSGETTPASSDEINQYLGKAFIDLALDLTLDKSADSITEEILGTSEGRIASVTAQLEATIANVGKDVIKTVTPTLNDIEDSASTIAANLLQSTLASLPQGSAAPTPTTTDSVQTSEPSPPSGSQTPIIGLSASNLVATIQQGVSQVTGSFTIENVGGGSMSVTVAPSGRVQDSISRQGNVVTVSLSAGTGDLSPGAYRLGSITVSSPNASNSPQVVTVGVVVTPAQSSPFNPPIYSPPPSFPTYPVNPPVTNPGTNPNQPPGSNPEGTTTYYLDYRFPDTGFAFAIGPYDSEQRVLDEFNQTLQGNREAWPDGPANQLISEYRLHKISPDNKDQVIQDQKVS